MTSPPSARATRHPLSTSMLPTEAACSSMSEPPTLMRTVVGPTARASTDGAAHPASARMPTSAPATAPPSTRPSPAIAPPSRPVHETDHKIR